MRHALILATGLSLVLAACTGDRALPPGALAPAQLLSGRVVFPARTAQTTLDAVANKASVSLIDASTQQTLATTVTDASGQFNLSFSALSPKAGSTYYLDAYKGLEGHRAGAATVRLRTLLFWNGGWQSLTNATLNAGVTLSAATTAIATAVSLKQAAGTALDLAKLINTVNGSAFAEAGTGLSNANDFTPVLSHVTNALTLDQDPLASIAYDATTGTYTLASRLPWVSSVSPAIGTPGGSLTLKGENFESLSGRYAFYFGTTAASTWSVSADRRTLTVPIPATAYSAPLTMRQPNGASQILAGFYRLRGTVGTLAGAGIAGSRDGTGLEATFNQPVRLMPDADGNLLVSEYVGNRIRRVTPDGRVTTFVGGGAQGIANGTGTEALFFRPGAMVTMPGGDYLLSDMWNHMLRRITPSGIVTLYAGVASDSIGLPGNTDGDLATASFNLPVGMRYRGTDLYVADTTNHKIRKIDASGNVTTFAGTGVAGDAAGVGGQLYGPRDLVFDTSGNMFVCQFPRHTIRKIAPDGAISTFAGAFNVAANVDDTGAAARFSKPQSLTIDAANNLYVVDFGNHKIRKVTPAGVVTTLAGSGVQGYADGPLLDARFNQPTGAYLAPDNTLYVTDEYNHRIRVVTF
ncbi:IPT/TIG domain-containing protein [bacterium]|nr:IPT/TIG domain-containing protein [bacterium]